MSHGLNEIVGLSPVKIDQTDEEISMAFENGSSCKFYHDQDCCESVVVDDVNGEWKDLIGHPILVAEVRESETPPENGSETCNSWDDSNTWTFYTFRGQGGSVDVRWHGSSNGYYSESVDFIFND